MDSTPKITQDWSLIKQEEDQQQPEGHVFTTEVTCPYQELAGSHASQPPEIFMPENTSHGTFSSSTEQSYVTSNIDQAYGYPSGSTISVNVCESLSSSPVREASYQRSDRSTFDQDESDGRPKRHHSYKDDREDDRRRHYRRYDCPDNGRTDHHERTDKYERRERRQLVDRYGNPYGSGRFERHGRPERDDKLERRERYSRHSRSEERVQPSDDNHQSKRNRENDTPPQKERSSEDNRQRSRSPLREKSESEPPPPKVDKFETEELFKKEISWMRSFPAEPFYKHDSRGTMIATNRLTDIQKQFKSELLDRNAKVRSTFPPFEFPVRKIKLRRHLCHHHGEDHDEDDSDCSSLEESDEDENDDDNALEELQRKKTHPWRLHEEIWYNDPGEMNDGPVCRCSMRARKSGIRHGIYPGEDIMTPCDPLSNNADRLYHYRLEMTPLVNFSTKFPTKIPYDSHDYVFEGFSLLSHFKLTEYPPCRLIRFNIEYTITVAEEAFPNNFTVADIDMISDYIFNEVLELIDINWRASEDPNGCPRFHLFPRFSRLIDEDGKELLAPAIILQYLLNSNKPLVGNDILNSLETFSDLEWDKYAVQVKGMIVVHPGSKPCALRVDQIDRQPDESEKKGLSEENAPVVIHFGHRPPQLSYAGNPEYQKAWRDYVKFKHLLANKPKVLSADRQTLLQKEEKLQELRSKADLKREVTIIVPTKDFYKTGLFCDVIQFALIIPVAICHLRFHQSLSRLEDIIGYKFKDRFLLQLALTHPSYRENFGTNPDHARNTLTNCGLRQPIYGDRKVHYQHTRKRGINMLIDIMSRLGRERETMSNIHHNERLEFLGDAVVEFLSSIHLYFMFPDLEEGGLATYRAAIVQNQHLAILAKKLGLEKYMLYAHGSDLCHDLELRHAMANCFEALMGALFLDGGIEVADRVFSNTLFQEDAALLTVWVNYPKHPIQRQDPDGDRHYLERFPRLRELQKFEEATGIQFRHIRLLARAFTHRSVGYNNLTLGSNQRMEFLGDTVLQLVASEYLYKFFPEHHEGHLSLLRSSLVNNKTQAVVCDDLGMTEYATYNYAKGDLKTKDRADLLEAFLGALYVDKGLIYCRRFCEVCFFPRLKDFIMNQDWNDPKSKLQQCCLTLRSSEGGEPDIPIYKVIESIGPTNTREYVVAVKFKHRRLATGRGHSIQEAEMNAASNALRASRKLFPQLSRQKKVIERSVRSDVYHGHQSQRRHKRRRSRSRSSDRDDYRDETEQKSKNASNPNDFETE